MNELIQIIQTHIGAEKVNSVDSRELYKALLLKSDFSTWIKRQLELFSENIDYVRLHKKVEANNATQIDYILTIDTAKHIAMIQRNEIGMNIRKYFIEVEKLQSLQLPQTYIEALEALTASEKDKAALVEIGIKKDESIASKTQTIINVVHNEHSYTASQVAKDMPQPISAKLFNKMLVEADVIFPQNGTYQLYSKYAKHNLTCIKETEPDKKGKTYLNLRWTALGKSWIYKNFDNIKKRVSDFTLSEWELVITSNLPKISKPKKK